MASPSDRSGSVSKTGASVSPGRDGAWRSWNCTRLMRRPARRRRCAWRVGPGSDLHVSRRPDSRVGRTILVSRRRTTLQEVAMALAIGRNLGMLLLAVYLIIVGLSGLIALPLGGPILSVLALLAGILLLAGR